MKKLLVVLILLSSVVSAHAMGNFPPAPEEEFPILMVHGMYGNARQFNQVKAYLEEQGWDESLLYAYSMPVDNLDLCSQDHVYQVAKWINDILDEHPGKKLALIGHSRGGLNIMQCLWQGLVDIDRINYVITLAGANRACYTTFPRIPRDETPGDALYTFMWSSDDYVTYYTTYIDGADSIEFSRLSHSDMITHEDVLTEVFNALNGLLGDNQ